MFSKIKYYLCQMIWVRAHIVTKIIQKWVKLIHTVTHTKAVISNTKTLKRITHFKISGSRLLSRRSVYHKKNLHNATNNCLSIRAQGTSTKKLLKIFANGNLLIWSAIQFYWKKFATFCLTMKYKNTSWVGECIKNTQNIFIKL